MERDYGGREGTRKLRNINGILVQHGGDGGGGKEEPDCLEVKEIPNAPRGLTHGKSSKVRRQEGISRFYIIQAAIRGVQARRKSICEIRKKDMAHLSQPPNLGRTQSSESAYV
ncbi:gap junction delta-2 protein [Scomber scombrus]|uniref:Gap junction delta-2 protein n=1 Tax=Scomber scombrus TaxID=13677 RepID=A0AAV1PU87_SCOSC